MCGQSVLVLIQAIWLCLSECRRLQLSPKSSNAQRPPCDLTHSRIGYPELRAIPCRRQCTTDRRIHSPAFIKNLLPAHAMLVKNRKVGCSPCLGLHRVIQKHVGALGHRPVSLPICAIVIKQIRKFMSFLVANMPNRSM